MSLYCSMLCAKIPHILRHRKRSVCFTVRHLEAETSSRFLSFHNKKLSLSSHIGFVSKFEQIYCSPLMEEDRQMVGLVSQSEEYSKELDVAVRAVQMACSLCQKVQDTLISKPSKDFNSSVTVAGWSVKAIVSWILSECFKGENISILAEEEVQTLSNTNASELLEAVVKIANECLAEAPLFGVEAPKSALGTSEVLEIISHCNSVGVPSGRFWALSPLDGNLGFVNGDQYAVALSLIEDGEVMVGVLGCPNYPMRKDWLGYQQSYHRLMSKLIPHTSETWNKGCVIYAKKDSGKAWIQPVIHHANKKFVWPNHAKQVSVSSVDNLGLATFCQSVEKANSSHSFTDGLAHSVGLSNKPLRVYSMMKYVAIACGDAEMFMKFARSGYKEKIWDHAAGVIILQEAGATVTDVRGRSLDFSKGSSYLEGIDRGIVASAGSTLHEKIIDAVDASWASSSL